MAPFRPFLPFAAFLGIFAICIPARATFSIVATEPAKAAIGSAGASCVPYEVIRILAVAKGKGLLVAQANFDDGALAMGAAMLAADEPPAAVLATITDAAKYPQAPKMQYGIVDVAGNTASYTGLEALAFAGDQASQHNDFSFTVQGNILTGASVLDQMAMATTEGCDLPEKLMRSIEAAGLQGSGDSRCTDGGISAASAYIYAEEKGQTILQISLPDLRPGDPIAELRKQFDVWRIDHPCPISEPVNPGQTNFKETPGCSLAPPSPNRNAWLVWLVAAVALWQRRLRASAHCARAWRRKPN